MSLTFPGASPPSDRKLGAVVEPEASEPAPTSALDEFSVDPATLAPSEPSRRRLERHRSSLPALVLSDAVALAVAFLAGSVVYGLFQGRAPLSDSVRAIPYLIVFLPVLSCYGLYRRARRRLVASMFPDLSQLLHGVIVGCLLTLVVTGLAARWLSLPLIHRGTIALVGVFALVVVPVARAITRWMLRPSGQDCSNVLVVGSGQVASTVLQRLTNVENMHIVGCVDDGFPFPGEPAADSKLLGSLDDLRSIVVANNVDHIIVAFSPATGAKLAALLRSLADDVQISVVPRLFDLLTVRSHVDDLHGLPVVDVAPAALGPADRFAKRALDIALSAIGLLVLSPLLIGVAVAVKLTSPGPVFFRQQRTGRNGDPFGIFKFRTMRAGAEQERSTLVGSNEVDGPLFKMHDDPRITKVGGLLRKTSIDEIPQFLNVFKGDMSLVGPRPFVTSESAEIAGWAARRFAVRPGMTGLWQISGRTDLPFEELCRLDYSYVASWSLWWDLRILWHTPASVLRRRGAY